MTKENKIIHPDFSSYFVKRFGILMILATISIIILSYSEMIGNDIGVYIVYISFVLSIFLLISVLYTRYTCKTTEIFIDTTNIVYKHGILRKRKKSVPIERITDTSINASVIDGLLGTATLNISTAGQDGYFISFRDMEREKAIKFQNQINSFIKNRDILSNEQEQT